MLIEPKKSALLRFFVISVDGKKTDNLPRLVKHLKCGEVVAALSNPILSDLDKSDFLKWQVLAALNRLMSF